MGVARKSHLCSKEHKGSIEGCDPYKVCNKHLEGI